MDKEPQAIVQSAENIVSITKVRRALADRILNGAEDEEFILIMRKSVGEIAWMATINPTCDYVYMTMRRILVFIEKSFH